MAFKKAEKQQLWLRLAIHGGPGSGKTVSSILLASGIGSRIAVIDTENRSAEKATRDFPVEFDVCYLSDFHPHNYVREIQTAVKEGYEVLIIDSLSHAWTGKGGVLEVVEQAKEKNQFTAWAKGTPLQNDLIDAIIQAPIHIIATMRSKEKYVIEKNEYGKDVPRKIGVEPIQRDGMYYEFDVGGRFDEDLNLVIEKSRALFLRNKTIHKPDAQFGAEIKEWLLQGKPVPKPFICSPELVKKLVAANKAAEAVGLSVDDVKNAVVIRIGSDDLRSFNDEKMQAALDAIHDAIEAKKNPQVSDEMPVTETAPALSLVPPAPAAQYPSSEDLPDTNPLEILQAKIRKRAWEFGLATTPATYHDFARGLLGCELRDASEAVLHKAAAAVEKAATSALIKQFAAETWKVSSAMQFETIGLIVAANAAMDEEKLLKITGNSITTKDAKAMKTIIANLTSWLTPEEGEAVNGDH